MVSFFLGGGGGGGGGGGTGGMNMTADIFSISNTLSQLLQNCRVS